MTGPEAVARLTGVGLVWMGVHCAGMCGPLLLGLDVGGSRAPSGRTSRAGVALRTLLYQLGKAVSYAVVGALAGFVGASAEDASGAAPGVFAVVAGVVAIVVATGVAKGKDAPVVRIGAKKTTTQTLLALLQPLLTSTHPARPFLLGLALAFLPCMISLWALSLAALTSSPRWGALVMLTLALWTTPLLLCLAEEVTKQLSVCIVCGAPAARSQRVHKDAALFARTKNETILVGGGDAYEARCRVCYVQGIDTPATATRR